MNVNGPAHGLVRKKKAGHQDVVVNSPPAPLFIHEPRVGGVSSETQNLVGKTCVDE